MSAEGLPPVTLIRVPQNVAEEWQAASSREGGSRALGSINKRERTLEISEPLLQRGTLAKKYHVQAGTDTQLTTLVFSKHGDQFALEGRAEPMTVKPDLADAVYAKQRAAASAEANAEKHHTMVDTSLPQRLDALNRADEVMKVAKHKRIAKGQFESSRQELEGTLFDMFKERDRWKIKEVARALDLSHAHASELLKDIADKIKSGPYRGEWQLKPEYQQTDEAAAAAPPDANMPE